MDCGRPVIRERYAAYPTHVNPLPQNSRAALSVTLRRRRLLIVHPLVRPPFPHRAFIRIEMRGALAGRRLSHS